MNILRWVLLFSLFSATTSEALVYEYKYFGNPMYFDEELSLRYGWDPDSGAPIRPVIDAYTGIMRIDEEKLPGGTLVNADVFFDAQSAIWHGSTSGFESPLGILYRSSQVEGLLAFDIHPFPDQGLAWINFSTDENRNIVKWESFYVNHYPDGGTSGEYGDTQDSYDGVVNLSAPGRWSAPSIVPLPGSLVLFGSAVLGFFGLRFRSRSTKK